MKNISTCLFLFFLLVWDLIIQSSQGTNLYFEHINYDESFHKV
jgi:hypothetical protein